MTEYDIVTLNPLRVIDSYLGTTYPNHRLYAIVYEPYWQATRAMCYFGEHEDARQSLARLFAYINAVQLPRELAIRTFRVERLLKSLSIDRTDSYGFRFYPDSVFQLVELAKDDLEESRIGLPPIDLWDWHHTRTQLASMVKTDLDVLQESYRKLRGNRAHRAGRGPKHELTHYLAMLKEAIDE